MKKRLCMTLASLFLFVGLALAQTTVKGTVVTYEENEPIIGASIQVVGATNIGTITDVNGNFSLQVPAGRKTLKITYVGMEPLEVAVTDKPIRIQLRNDANNLDEVVVVAYGTQKKTSLTGSIEEVKSEEILMRPTSSVATALEGMVTGVQVNSTYGVPGNDPSIRIRGIGTVNGSSSPLYIVDGVPFGGNISDLNPQDIESMSVLKDAASAALYGNRASNGVILITTKKGKQGKLNVTLDIKQGSNITLTAAAGSLTIAGTADTKNTAGSTDTSSKIFLIGATSQAANPRTYSQDTTYVDTDATLASTKVRVAEKCTLQFNTTTNALDFVFA